MHYTISLSILLAFVHSRLFCISSIANYRSINFIVKLDYVIVLQFSQTGHDCVGTWEVNEILKCGYHYHL